MITIWESLLFFLPAFVANQCPGFLAGFLRLTGRSEWNLPISERWLGGHKTLPAYPAAIAGAIGTLYLERWMSGGVFYNYPDKELWLIGFVFGVGVVVGDQVKSFIKRLRKIPPGAKWRPWDQIDFVVGGLLAISLVFGWEVILTALILIPVTIALNPTVNRLGFLFHIKEVPH